MFPKNHKSARRSRRLCFESLESREMLAVTLAEFEAIRGQYPDLNLADPSGYNIIEITAEQLSEAALRQAIQEAAATTQNDLIVLRTTETSNTITLSGTELGITINAAGFGSVAIVSLGTSPLTIDANQESRVLSIARDSTVALAGVTITGGLTTSVDICANPASGGGIFNSGNLIVTGCTISGNVAQGGGPPPTYDPINGWWISLAVYCSSCGGGITNVGELTVTNSLITENSADGGGGIANSGVLTVADSTVTKNSGWWWGGGISNGNGTLTIANSEITENSAGLGGGIYNNYFSDFGTFSIVTLDNTTVTGNTPDNIYNNNGTVQYADYVPPTYYITGPGELIAGQVCRWEFEAVGSSPIMDWEIDWGDWSEPTSIHGGPRSRVGASHLYRWPGQYAITIKTTDFNGVVTSVTIGPYEVKERVALENSSRECERPVQVQIALEPKQPVQTAPEPVAYAPGCCFYTDQVETMRQRQMLDLDQSPNFGRESVSFTEFVWADDDLFEGEWTPLGEPPAKSDFWDGVFEEELLLQGLFYSEK